MLSQNRVEPSYYFLNPIGRPYRYLTLSGTSMATPVVAGAVALMLQKEPTLNNHTVKLRLMASANKSLQAQYDVFTVGAGLLDIPAALNQTGTASSSRSPYAQRDPLLPVV